MKLADSQRRTSRPAAEPSPRDKTTPTRGRGALAIPEVVARAFAVANAGLRVRVLSRLINSAGTMALAVLFLVIPLWILISQKKYFPLVQRRSSHTVRALSTRSRP